MAIEYLRKYGVETTLDFPLYTTDGASLKTDAVHAAGDTKIMKDEGAEANTTNGFVDEGQGYSIPLSATEMQAARIMIHVVDQTSPKVWIDESLIVETYGNASAQHELDLDAAINTSSGVVEANVKQVDDDAAAAANMEKVFDNTGYDMSNSKIGEATALSSGERTNLADAFLKRDFSSVSGEAARSVLNALRFLRNKWNISGSTLTVTKEDDATSAWTGTVTTNASADPVTGVDPT